MKMAGVSLKPVAMPIPMPFHRLVSGRHRSASTISMSTRFT
jgi:hypothetical protein